MQYADVVSTAWEKKFTANGMKNINLLFVRLQIKNWSSSNKCHQGAYTTARHCMNYEIWFEDWKYFENISTIIFSEIKKRKNNFGNMTVISFCWERVVEEVTMFISPCSRVKIISFGW